MWRDNTDNKAVEYNKLCGQLDEDVRWLFSLPEDLREMGVEHIYHTALQARRIVSGEVPGKPEILEKLT